MLEHYKGQRAQVGLPGHQTLALSISCMLTRSGACCAGQSDRDSGPTGSLQEAAEHASSTEGSLVQAGEPSMPLPGARSLSDGQLDSLMGQLAGMPDEKGRKDLLGMNTVACCDCSGALTHPAVPFGNCLTPNWLCIKPKSDRSSLALLLLSTSEAVLGANGSECSHQVAPDFAALDQLGQPSC